MTTPDARLAGRANDPAPPAATYRRIAVAALLLGIAACGTAPPPQPGTSPVAPDLRGVPVMVLPVQQTAGISGDADAELAFALTDRGPRVEWILPDEIQRVLDRSPGIDAGLYNLPVGVFLVAEVRQVGDPLFGELRRLGALSGADIALIPVRIAYQAADTVSGPGVRIHGTLVDVRTGRVLWYGVEQGGDHPPGDPRSLASAADAFARSLLRIGGR